MSLRTLRIFVSSPGDVGAERLAAQRVVERMAREFGHVFALEAIMWEHEPLRATAHYQEQILPPSESDIAIVILWTRLGTRLPKDKFASALGSAQVTGTQWEFEDAVRSFRQRRTPDLMVYRKTAAVQIDLADDALLDRRREEKRLLDAFLDRWFLTDTAEFKAAFWPFETTDKFEELLEMHLRKLLRERLRIGGLGAARGEAAQAWHAGSPYRGLEAFDFAHADIFFGRTRAGVELREALLAQAQHGVGFIVVFGMSGSGKSSLVKAGLLPDITVPGVVERLGLCRWTALRPSDSPDDLGAGLVRALLAQTALPELAERGWDQERLVELVRDSPDRLGEAVRDGLVLAAARENLTKRAEARLCLIVDQLEELFTLDKVSPAERNAFAALVATLARSGAVWVIATMRSDFYHRLEETPTLAALAKGAGSYHLLPPQTGEIGQMIRLPAQAARLSFEIDAKTGIGLDQVLEDAAAGSPAALPLLEFTLDELFKQRSEAGVLTYAEYRRLGGLEGALARRAEETFAALAPAAQTALPDVLQALVTVGGGDDDIAASRRVPLAEAGATVERRALIDAFLKARLLVADRTDDGSAIVRVAHESLLGHWPRLRAWLDENREFLRARARVADAAARWRVERGADDFLLHEGKPLAEARELLAKRRTELGAEAVQFIEASLAADERRQQRRRDDERRLFEAERQRLETEAKAARDREAAQRRQSRILRIAAAAMAALAVAAGAVGYVAYEKSIVARKNFALAFDAADALVSDVAAKLRDLAGVPSATVVEILTISEKIFTQLVEVADDGARLAHRHAAMLLVFADAYESIGNSAEQLKRALAAQEKLAALVAQDPASTALQGDLARAYSRIAGARQAQGDLAGALRALTAGHAIQQRLATAAPDDVERLSALATSHHRIGDVRWYQGDFAAAREAYLAGYTIAEGLVTLDPGNWHWQVLLATSRSDIGDTWRAQGDLAEALNAYRASLAIRERLARADSRNSALQSDLADSNKSVGDVLRTMNEPAAALVAYRTAHAVRERLAAQDPDNAPWQGDLAGSFLDIGEAQKTLGDPRAARESFHAANAISQLLATRDPGNAEWQRGLATSLLSSGDAEWALGDLAAALAAYRDGHAIRARLAQQDPGNAHWQFELAESHSNIGDTRRAQADTTGALESYQAARAVLERLAAMKSPDTDWLKELAVMFNKIGDVRWAGGDFAGALGAYRGVLGMRQRLADLDPQSAPRQQALAGILGDIGDAQRALGDGHSAAESYLAALAIHERLIAAGTADAALRAAILELRARLREVRP